MRSFYCSGGFTRGRGVTNSFRVNTMHRYACVNNAASDFTNLQVRSLVILLIVCTFYNVYSI